uniref:Cyclic nucleotide-binding domain-containing protein n=1 Tax=Candidatus Kentrum sp. TUN TaxID=2126343 RepID=A0A450ZTI2_9GAMM|nr:MAG: Cyclic nucleotide-binding domain-containing protein [Candidatus Kentron sp. TUN]VFK55356.1 MAG: Cyclic nucleotide-binding domain-containing protein [Candidatus Kentron sp. TUN]VFK57099.1 MAG: Cyclic nucleotide-binding domain-containing protein [Candidatus Kentron sp. TUN]
MSNLLDSKQLHASVLGDELDIEECRTLITKMGIQRLTDGEFLVTVDNSDHTLFILMEGRIAVINDKGKDQNIMYTMKKGECAGTRAFVDRTPRKATLRSIGDTTVYTLEPNALESLLDTHPRIVYKVMRALFRITHTNLMRMNLESQQLVNYISRTKGRY